MSENQAAVLVVDDVAENRDLLVRRLKRFGISRIDEAANGHEALAAIEQTPYDLMLLDIMMPELDGFGVLEALRRDGRLGEPPVIVISALNELDPVVRCIELGADDFIFKPFNPTLLRARVLATLEKKALRDRTRDELRRKQAELNEARSLQLSLVPPSFEGSVSGRRIGIEVLLEPAKEVGGDLVDYAVLDEGLVVVAIGDVSDKGAGAALMMARTHAMLRALAMRADAAALFADPARAVDLLNAALLRGNQSCMFVTFLLATLDVTNGRLSYVRAGHVPPWLRRGDGTLTRLTAPGGPALGVVEGIAYRSSSVELQDGDEVLGVTDGFTEAVDLSAQEFGEARVAAAFASGDPDGARLARLSAEVRLHEQGQPAFDDRAGVLLSLGRSVAV